MKHLYEISADMLRALNALEPDENGEIALAAVAALDALEIEFRDKVESVAKFIRNLEAEAGVHRAKAQPFIEEAKRHGGRARACDARVEWLKGYLRGHMAKLGIDKVDGDLRVSLGKAPQVVNVTDESAIPPNYYRPSEPDKTAILRALKAGAKISGAELADGKRTLRIT